MPEPIDFYLYATHEVPTFRPIVAALRGFGADPRFVLEPPGRNVARGSMPEPGRGWLDDKSGSNLGALLDDRTMTIIENQLERAGETWLSRRRFRAAAVTTSGARWLRPYAGARIRCMYGVGAGAGAYGHGVINDGFDLVLAHGAHSVSEILSRVPDARAVSVGFPKWAAYRRGSISRIGARTRLGIAVDRPVVAWLPTWAQHSSIESYRPMLEKVARDALVIVKPHHNTARFEMARLDSFDQIKTLHTTTSLVDVLAACDVAVTDIRSGSTTESLLADRPTVVVVPPVASGSILPWIEDAVHLCTDPNDLASALEDARLDAKAGARRRAVPRLFEPTSGNDDELAAIEILHTATAHRASYRSRLRARRWGIAYRAARAIGR